MILRDITLQGFKSFGDEITKIFFENGLNLITGPNGSGKSVIIDALRIIAGEDIERSKNLVNNECVSAKIACSLINNDYVNNIETKIEVDISKKGNKTYSLNGKRISQVSVSKFFRSINLDFSSKFPTFIIAQHQILGLMTSKPQDFEEAIIEASGAGDFLRTIDELKVARETIYRTQEDLSLKILELTKQTDKMLIVIYAEKNLQEANDELNFLTVRQIKTASILAQVRKIAFSNESHELELQMANNSENLKDIQESLASESTRVEIMREECSQLHRQLIYNMECIDVEANSVVPQVLSSIGIQSSHEMQCQLKSKQIELNELQSHLTFLDNFNPLRVKKCRSSSTELLSIAESKRAIISTNRSIAKECSDAIEKCHANLKQFNKDELNYSNDSPNVLIAHTKSLLKNEIIIYNDIRVKLDKVILKIMDGANMLINPNVTSCQPFFTTFTLKKSAHPFIQAIEVLFEGWNSKIIIQNIADINFTSKSQRKFRFFALNYVSQNVIKSLPSENDVRKILSTKLKLENPDDDVIFPMNVLEINNSKYSNLLKIASSKVVFCKSNIIAKMIPRILIDWEAISIDGTRFRSKSVSGGFYDSNKGNTSIYNMKYKLDTSLGNIEKYEKDIENLNQIQKNKHKKLSFQNDIEINEARREEALYNEAIEVENVKQLEKSLSDITIYEQYKHFQSSQDVRTEHEKILKKIVELENVIEDLQDKLVGCESLIPLRNRDINDSTNSVVRSHLEELRINTRELETRKTQLTDSITNSEILINTYSYQIKEMNEQQIHLGNKTMECLQRIKSYSLEEKHLQQSLHENRNNEFGQFHECENNAESTEDVLVQVLASDNLKVEEQKKEVLRRRNVIKSARNKLNIGNLDQDIGCSSLFIENKISTRKNLEAKMKIIAASTISLNNGIDDSLPKAESLVHRTFTNVRDRYQQLVEVLIPGIRATLKRSDSGVELLICGKEETENWRKVQILSGGQQTLVMIAFILSIADYRRSSLYILDEVDAALDESNIELYSKLLRQLAERGTQVLIVSHHQIVHQKSGAKKIISVSMPQTGQRESVSQVTQINVQVK